MKRNLTILASLLTPLTLPAPALADGFSDRELTFQVMNALDAAQTISCLDRNICHEANPLLGRNPSVGKIIAFKAGIGGLHFLLARHLNERDPRAARIFQIATIAVQGGVVAANLRFTF